MSVFLDSALFPVELRVLEGRGVRELYGGGFAEGAAGSAVDFGLGTTGCGVRAGLAVSAH